MSKGLLGFPRPLGVTPLKKTLGNNKKTLKPLRNPPCPNCGATLKKKENEGTVIWGCPECGWPKNG